MSLTPYGWIEIRSQVGEKAWVGAVKIDTDLMRGDNNKLLMSYLFTGSHLPQGAIAGGRGLPVDVSAEAQQFMLDVEGHSPSWMLWREVQNIVWQEKTEVTPQGAPYRYKYIQEADDTIILTGGWKLVFDLMGVLAATHGVDNVRLVVWFG